MTYSLKIVRWAIFMPALLSGFSVSATSYMNQEEFLALVIQHSTSTEDQGAFETETIWLKKELQSKIKKILDHKYPKLRIRYKRNQSTENITNATTVWYLDEIGKDRPISFGISVRQNRIQLIRVLAFRETRGYEIKMPAFAQQFEQIGVNKQGALDHTIDGITGATMSVNAMKKIARVAILLHKAVLNINSSSQTSTNKN